MSHLYLYVLLGSLVFGINVFPLLMPSTALVLAYFYITYHLAFVPTLLAGVIAATLGRIVLAVLARNYFHHLFPKKMQNNFHSLGELLNRQKRYTVPIFILYMFFPIPSNHVFIAAGLANADLTVLGAAFFVGRLISYSFWMTTAHIVVKSLESVLTRRMSKTGAFTSEAVGLILLILVGYIPWRKLLKKKKK